MAHIRGLFHLCTCAGAYHPQSLNRREPISGSYASCQYL
nr:MAG TPA: hypothetical protein [Caudoviricetes sp.]